MTYHSHHVLENEILGKTTTPPPPNYKTTIQTQTKQTIKITHTEMISADF